MGLTLRRGYTAQLAAMPQFLPVVFTILIAATVMHDLFEAVLLYADFLPHTSRGFYCMTAFGGLHAIMWKCIFLSGGRSEGEEAADAVEVVLFGEDTGFGGSVAVGYAVEKWFEVFFFMCETLVGHQDLYNHRGVGEFTQIYPRAVVVFSHIGFAHVQGVDGGGVGH